MEFDEKNEEPPETKLSFAQKNKTKSCEHGFGICFLAEHEGGCGECLKERALRDKIK